MKKIFWLIAISLLIPGLSFARGLVPCGGTGEKMCTACDIFVLVQSVITNIFKYSFVIGGIIIIIAGFGMMFSRGNSSKVAQGWKSITNVIIGIVILLSAWLVVNTFLYYFAPGDPNLQKKWYKLECSGFDSGTQFTPINGADKEKAAKCKEYCNSLPPADLTAAYVTYDNCIQECLK